MNMYKKDIKNDGDNNDTSNDDKLNDKNDNDDIINTG